MAALQIPDWSPELSVGHPQIDAQHRQLIVLGKQAIELLYAPQADARRFHQLLNDIADAANVTRGAIYWHFENKTQLFNEMWLQQPSLRELIQEHLTAGLEHDPFQQLREKLIVGLQYIAKIPRQQALLKILYHKCEFNDEMLAEGVIREKMGFNPQTLREVLQACQQQGCVANNLDLDVVMIIIDGAFSGIVQNWLMNMAGYDLYKQAPALVDNVLRMFMPDENITKLIHQTNELSVM